MRGANNPVTPITLFQIRSMALSGDHTAAEIGRRLGLSTSTVQRAIAGRGLTLRTARSRVSYDRAVARVINGDCKIVDGYRKLFLPFHLGQGTGWVYEHRIIAERKLNRSLVSGEIVHHINQRRADNDPANLEVMSVAEHQALHRDLLKEEPAPTIVTASAGTGSNQEGA